MNEAIARRNLLRSGSLGLASGGLALALGARAAQGKEKDDDRLAARLRYIRRFSVDICCNANSIVFEGPQGPNPNPPNDPGPGDQDEDQELTSLAATDLPEVEGEGGEDDPGPHPYYGASFVVQGIIYPKGTLERLGLGSGLLQDGSPEFPDLVRGRWICRGWFIGDYTNPPFGGLFTPTGPFVATTQIYDFNNARPGSRMLISEGMELIDLNETIQRAVTGGTGFRFNQGQVAQRAIGANATGLFNFTFRFRLRP
ncbi:MAG: hypothetical protein AAF530_22950 [Pseudomonadota bacterium]